jgi:hypothetical protein
MTVVPCGSSRGRARAMGYTLRESILRTEMRNFRPSDKEVLDTCLIPRTSFKRPLHVLVHVVDSLEIRCRSLFNLIAASTVLILNGVETH